jgi:hypothetical protein
MHQVWIAKLVPIRFENFHVVVGTSVDFLGDPLETVPQFDCISPPGSGAL